MNNLLISGIVSIALHAFLFLAPADFNSLQSIDIDILKAPASIEIQMVHTVPAVNVQPQKAEILPLKEEAKAEKDEQVDVKKEEMSVPEAKPVVGAITKQISTLLVNKPPVYPRLARIKGWEGEVILLASISAQGQVIDINILSSSGVYTLDQAAIKAVRKWQFRNIHKTIQVKIPIKFVLK